jgi:hypothetical protein
MTAVIKPGPSIAHADAAVRSGERIMTHADAEATNDIDIVMGTVTPGETLSWAQTWAWSAPTLTESGVVKTLVKTSRDSIRDFYLTNRTRYNVTSIGLPYVRHSSDWYALIESLATFESVPDRDKYEQRWVLLSPMDGDEGITGEIAWGLFPQLMPGPSVTEDDRRAVYYGYLDGLRAQDVEAIMTLQAPGVQGAMRDYSGGEVFRYIDGAAELRAYYERLFRTFRVRSVEPIVITDREWYLFTELRWQVDVLAGPLAGQSGSLLTAEILPLDKGGRIYAHLGFGTGLLT